MTDTPTSTVYVLTENIAYEGSNVLGIYANKMDALADAHDAAHERQTGYYKDATISHWSNDTGSESVQLDDLTWIVTPQEVQ